MPVGAQTQTRPPTEWRRDFRIPFGLGNILYDERQAFQGSARSAAPLPTDNATPTAAIRTGSPDIRCYDEDGTGTLYTFKGRFISEKSQKSMLYNSLVGCSGGLIPGFPVAGLVFFWRGVCGSSALPLPPSRHPGGDEGSNHAALII